MIIGIFTECYDPVMNGVVVSIKTFKKSLESRGHKVIVFAPYHAEAKPEKNVYRFPSIKGAGRKLYPIMLPSVTVQARYLPEKVIESLDVIHAQHMFTAGRLARYVARKHKKPLVYTYHTLISDYVHYFGGMAWLVRIYLNNMSRRFCNTCNAVITPSNSMRKVLKGLRIKTPIDVVMTGIDPKNYSRHSSEALKAKYGIPQDHKILLYLSRIAKEKNIDLLLKSFVLVKKSYSKCHLIMVGGGPEIEWCKKRISELGLSDSITMTGMVPKEEANQLFGMADLFTFPSFTETQGIVIAEAMASGTPPVAVNKMGPTDLVHNGEDGFLTRVRVKDFSAMIIKLLRDDKLRARFAANGLKRIDEFSISAATTKMVDLYQRTISAFSGV